MCKAELHGRKVRARVKPWAELNLCEKLNNSITETLLLQLTWLCRSEGSQSTQCAGASTRSCPQASPRPEPHRTPRHRRARSLVQRRQWRSNC